MASEEHPSHAQGQRQQIRTMNPNLPRLEACGVYDDSDSQKREGEATSRTASMVAPAKTVRA
jgi:hypothetical protein